MLIKPQSMEKIVLTLYVTVCTVLIILSFSTMHYPLYFNLYCLISSLIAVVLTASGKCSHSFQMIMMACCFLAAATVYSTIYGSYGIVQDAFLAVAAICSLYFCVNLNFFIFCYTILFYAVCSIFLTEELVAPLKEPKELFVKLIVLILSQIILGALVSFINRAQQNLVDKNTSFMELLRIVEIKKHDAVAASKAKADFLANMSHEIRTPMNAIVGMTEMVLRDDISPTVRENARNIKSAGNSLLAIINDILDFSKIESGKMEIIDVIYQPTSVLNDVINIISVRLAEKNLELIVSVDPSIPHELVGDEIRLRQIILNLLNNAAKFTSAGHISLSLSCVRQDNKAVLHCAVSDTGSGIRKEDINKLFESFSRVDTRQNRSVEGTGLGLSICKNLLSLMGGTISVDSVYGEGSTFSFTLPQDIHDETPTASLPESSAFYVLYADESELICNESYNELTRLNVRTATACNIEKILSYEGEKFTHVFIAKKLYDEHINEIKRISGDAKIVVVIGKNQLPSDYPGVLMLRRTLYSAVYASVLSDAPRPVYEADEFRESFIAPDARILVVDDNAVNLKVVKGLLEPYRMQVYTAISGKDCLKLLETERYDIIFMDHMMPELDGIDTLRLIRAMDGEYYKTVPIIALTANAVSGVREMFFKEGFQDYVSKPIELAKLEKTLKHHLPDKYIRKSTEKVTRHDTDESFGIEINGVDTSRGLQLCGGNKKNYLDLLTVVVEDGKKKCERLRQLGAAKDYANYTIEAHALKSVAASIGAQSLSEFAKSHEFAGKENKYDIIDNGFSVLAARYDELICNISDALDKNGISTEKTSKTAAPDGVLAPISDSMLHDKLDELHKLIDGYDTDEAEALVSELSGYDITDELRGRLGRILSLLNDYLYEDALALLRGSERESDS